MTAACVAHQDQHVLRALGANLSQLHPVAVVAFQEIVFVFLTLVEGPDPIEKAAAAAAVAAGAAEAMQQLLREGLPRRRDGHHHLSILAPSLPPSERARGRGNVKARKNLDFSRSFLYFSTTFRKSVIGGYPEARNGPAPPPSGRRKVRKAPVSRRRQGQGEEGSLCFGPVLFCSVLFCSLPLSLFCAHNSERRRRKRKRVGGGSAAYSC